MSCPSRRRWSCGRWLTGGTAVWSSSWTQRQPQHGQQQQEQQRLGYHVGRVLPAAAWSRSWRPCPWPAARQPAATVGAGSRLHWARPLPATGPPWRRRCLQRWKCNFPECIVQLKFLKMSPIGAYGMGIRAKVRVGADWAVGQEGRRCRVYVGTRQMPRVFTGCVPAPKQQAGAAGRRREQLCQRLR